MEMKKNVPIIEEDLTGKRFGHLVAVRIVGYKRSLGGTLVPQWQCHCDCGIDHVSDHYNLVTGKSVSCGCRRHGNRKAVTHKVAHLWTVYCNMKYAHRGDMCQEWLDETSAGNGGMPAGYAAFEKWALAPVDEGGGGYIDGLNLYISRVDRAKEYGPDNCAFTVRRKISIPAIDGNERPTIAQVASDYNVSESIIRGRLNSGWSIDAIIHWLKHPEIRMRKSRKRNGYIDANGNVVQVPAYTTTTPDASKEN